MTGTTGVPTDRGWAWVVAVGAFVNLYCAYGTLRLLGVVFVEVLEYYNASSALSSLMYSLWNAASLLTMPMYPFLMQYVSNRAVSLMGALVMCFGFVAFAVSPNIYFFTIIFGLCHGSSSILVSFSTFGILGQYFTEKLSIATGIACCGISIAQITLPLGFDYLVRTEGLTGAMVLFAGLILQQVAASSLYTPPRFYANNTHKRSNMSEDKNVQLVRYAPMNCDKVSVSVINVPLPFNYEVNEQTSNSNNQEDGPDTKSTQLCPDIRSLWSLGFLVFTAARFLALLAGFVITFLTPPYARSIGFTSEQVALMLSIPGWSDMPVRLLHGWLVSLSKVDTSVYMGSCVVLGSFSVIVCCLVPSKTATMAMANLFMLSFSAVTVLAPVSIIEYVGQDMFPQVFTISMMPHSFVLIFLPIVFGYMYDITGSYTTQMLISATAGVLGGIIMIVERLTRNRGKQLST